MSDNKFKILFVCTGNTCRSPMAEYALRSLLEAKVPNKTEVGSAGIAAADGYPATMFGAEASKMWDLDLSGHKSRMLTDEMIDDADLIFALAPEHHRQIIRLNKAAAEKTFLLKNFPDNSPNGEGVEDPIGQSLDRYNETFLEIGELLGKHLDEIVKRVNEKFDE